MPTSFESCTCGTTECNNHKAAAKDNIVCRMNFFTKQIYTFREYACVINFEFGWTRIANLGCAEDWPSWASVGIVLDNALQRLQRCGLFLCPTPLSKLSD